MGVDDRSLPRAHSFVRTAAPPKHRARDIGGVETVFVWFRRSA